MDRRGGYNYYSAARVACLQKPIYIFIIIMKFNLIRIRLQEQYDIYRRDNRDK